MTIKNDLTTNELTGTARDFAAQWAVDYLDAVGFIRFLERKGFASRIWRIKSISGKGKPSVIYSIPKTVTFNFES